MDEAQRMNLLLNHLKINASQFSKKTGIPQPSVSAIANGNKRITIEILHRIVKAYPFLSLDWLMKGVGTMFYDTPETVASEPLVDYLAIKSTKSELDGLPDEETMKGILSDNLRTTGKKWNLNQAEMLELLGYGMVGKGSASNYFRGDTMPRLPLLLRLERLSGWPLVVLASRAIHIDQIPPAPLLDAPLIPRSWSVAETAEMVAELKRLRSRISRIIDQHAAQ